MDEFHGVVGRYSFERALVMQEVAFKMNLPIYVGEAKNGFDVVIETQTSKKSEQFWRKVEMVDTLRKIEKLFREGIKTVSGERLR